MSSKRQTKSSNNPSVPYDKQDVNTWSSDQIKEKCLRKKMPDKIEQSWSKRGHLYYKSKSNKDNIKEVEYKDFQMWIDFPWPTN